MIVQTAPEGEPHLVIRMSEHMAFAGAFAEAFGNRDFEPVSPRELMIYVVGHHDRGWAALDEAVEFDSQTGLPYNVIGMPLARIIETSRLSPDGNESHHPFCGLLSSMHSWGLYNGRYGFSDHVLLDNIDADVKPRAEAMLKAEEARQERLREVLGANPQTRPWVAEAALFQNYKQLQFFDTLALYFNLTDDSARAPATFTHVPRRADMDETIALEPSGDRVYRLTPFPFAGDSLTVAFTGRLLEPASDGDWEPARAALKRAPAAEQTVTLVAP